MRVSLRANLWSSDRRGEREREREREEGGREVQDGAVKVEGREHVAHGCAAARRRGRAVEGTRK